MRDRIGSALFFRSLLVSATDTGDPIASDTFSGRRVQVRP